MIEIQDLLPSLKLRMQYRINTEYNDTFLLNELFSAFQKVAKKRWVALEDLEDIFAQDIINIALYNINLIGGDFQISHSENGISRSFLTEEEILKSVPTKGIGF